LTARCYDHSAPIGPYTPCVHDALPILIAAVLLAVRQANRLASPLTDLAETAERLGSGDPRPRHRRYGVPELDRVADVLDSSAERIARMLTAERRLAADASQDRKSTRLNSSHVK